MDINRKIFTAGVVGAGGAGFPTYKKLVPGTDWLIINAAECEPLLQTDIYVLTKNTRELIETLEVLKKEFGFKRVVIGIKSHHTQAISLLKTAIDEKKSSVEIFSLGGFYPVGDEQVLIHEVTGLTVPPGGIPLEVGVVVVNSTTTLNIYNSLKNIPVTEKTLTITGEVNTPTIATVPIGTSVADCIKLAGGARVEDYFIILGGPMMGSQYDKSEKENIHINKTDSAVIILPTNHYLKTFLDKKFSWVANQARSACIQCDFCTDLCPRYLIGHQMRPSRVMRALATQTYVEELTEAFLCCECGICELYACPMGLSPRQVNIEMKKRLKEQGITDFNRQVYPEHTKMFPNRKIPQKRIVYRLALEKYDAAIKNYIDLQPDKVSINYKQGIGKLASSVVAVGDKVKKGQLIAKIEYGEVGSNIHASIDGTVTEINNIISIEKI